MSELHPEGMLRQVRIYHPIQYTRHLTHPQFTDPENYCETTSYTDTRMEVQATIQDFFASKNTHIDLEQKL